MKRTLVIFATLLALFTLSACHDDSMDTNKMGTKLEKKYVEKIAMEYGKIKTTPLYNILQITREKL